MCSICLNEGPEFVNLACNHSFHVSCLSIWFNSMQNPTCPICRRKIDVRIYRLTNYLSIYVLFDNILQLLYWKDEGILFNPCVVKYLNYANRKFSSFRVNNSRLIITRKPFYFLPEEITTFVIKLLEY